MAKCIHTRDKSAERYFLNRMDDREEMLFQEHLAGCGDCRDRIDKLRTFAGELEAGMRGIRKPEFAAPSRKASGGRVLWRSVSIAAGIAVIVLGGVMLLKRGPVDGGLPAVAGTNGDTTQVDTDSVDAAQPAVRLDSRERAVTGRDEQSMIASESSAAKPAGMENKGVELSSQETRSLASSDSTVVAVSRLTMLAPDVTRKKFILRDGKNNVFEFKWAAPQREKALLVIRAGGKDVGQFIVEKDGGSDRVKVNLWEYRQYPKIDWYLMYGSTDNRLHGVIELYIEE